jgi:hypothetical protein
LLLLYLSIFEINFEQFKGIIQGEKRNESTPLRNSKAKTGGSVDLFSNNLTMISGETKQDDNINLLFEDNPKAYLTDDETSPPTIQESQEVVEQSILTKSINSIKKFMGFATEEKNLSKRKSSRRHISFEKEKDDDKSPTLSYLISPSMSKMKIYKDWSFLVPFCSKKNFYINENEGDECKTVNLSELFENAQRKKFTLSKIKGSLDGFFMFPTGFSVYLHCERCNYLNGVPLCLIEIYNKQIFNTINETIEATCVSTMTKDDLLNFNVDWLKTTQLKKISTQQIPDDIAIELYECPRCKNNTKSDTANSSQTSILRYIYRFLFKMKFYENCCRIFPEIPFLIEGDEAFDLAGSINPSMFYCSRTSAHNVMRTIKESFNKQRYFTIESYNLEMIGKDLNDNQIINMNSTSHILYKIVKIEKNSI